MINILDKLTDVCKELTVEKGELWLFALVLRENSPDRWDLVVAAPWITNSKTSFEFVVRKLRERLTASDDVIQISRVVIASADSPVVDIITSHCHQQCELIRLKDVTIPGMAFTDAFVFTANRPPNLSTVQPVGIVLNQTD